MNNTRINARKFDGTIHRSWQAKLIRITGEMLVFAGTFDQQVDHPDLGLIRRGTVSYEYFWLDRWYNVFQFFEPEGAFRNYYCNIAMPPTFSAGTLNYVDLDIDLIVSADFTIAVLDLDEFESHSKTYGYPSEVRRRAKSAISDLQDSIRRKSVPFDQATRR